MLSLPSSASTCWLRRIAITASRPQVRSLVLDFSPHKAALLGLGRPLNDVYPDQFSPESGRRLLRFKNALQDWEGEPLTLRERSMMGMIEAVMRKKYWQQKVFDEKICARWHIEALRQNLSERMFEYCIAELRDNARFSEQRGFAAVLDATATVYAGDDYIDEDIRSRLRQGTETLECKLDREKDWHPGFGGKVLNLVHPSLYPLVYGRSRAILGSAADEQSPRGPWKGEIIPMPGETDCELATFYDIGQGMHTPSYSQKFQWLPCDVHFEANDRVRIASYINNLHPYDNQSLYSAIEKIIEKAVPMWNETLKSAELNYWYARIQVTNIALADSAKRPRPPADNEDTLDEDEKGDLDMKWADEIYAIVPPEPRDYSIRSRIRQSVPTEGHNVDIRSDFAEQGVQIIVKLANIHLTPENPDYDGGSWHIEGQLNEHIRASALYYYDSHNVSDSYLAFRERVDDSALEALPYEQGQYKWIEDFYGMENDVEFIQELGHVLTNQGRLLTFPNVLQHRVEPFRLADPTKSGHRKMLALFLVDPHLRIPSTSIVPPQQKEWWEKSSSLNMMPGLPQGKAHGFYQSNSEALMDLQEAKKLRLELMAEKSAFVEDTEVHHLKTSTNFCEH